MALTEQEKKELQMLEAELARRQQAQKPQPQAQSSGLSAEEQKELQMLEAELARRAQATQTQQPALTREQTTEEKSQARKMSSYGALGMLADPSALKVTEKGAEPFKAATYEAGQSATLGGLGKLLEYFSPDKKEELDKLSQENTGASIAGGLAGGFISPAAWLDKLNKVQKLGGLGKSLLGIAGGTGEAAIEAAMRDQDVGQAAVLAGGAGSILSGLGGLAKVAGKGLSPGTKTAENLAGELGLGFGIAKKRKGTSKFEDALPDLQETGILPKDLNHVAKDDLPEIVSTMSKTRDSLQEAKEALKQQVAGQTIKPKDLNITDIRKNIEANRNRLKAKDSSELIARTDRILDQLEALEEVEDLPIEQLMDEIRAHESNMADIFSKKYTGKPLTMEEKNMMEIFSQLKDIESNAFSKLTGEGAQELGVLNRKLSSIYKVQDSFEDALSKSGMAEGRTGGWLNALKRPTNIGTSIGTGIGIATGSPLGFALGGLAGGASAAALEKLGRKTGLASSIGSGLQQLGEAAQQASIAGSQTMAKLGYKSYDPNTNTLKDPKEMGQYVQAIKQNPGLSNIERAKAIHNVSKKQKVDPVKVMSEEERAALTQELSKALNQRTLTPKEMNFLLGRRKESPYK